MSELFSALESFTSVFSEDINKQAKECIMSLFAFINAFTREKERYNHMKVINTFCINILLRKIKTAELDICIICKDLLFQIQHRLALKLEDKNQYHFQNPFGPNFHIFRKNVNELIDLIKSLKSENSIDIEINYTSVMLSDKITNSFYMLLGDTLNVCNTEGIRAQQAMPNVLSVIESI